MIKEHLESRQSTGRVRDLPNRKVDRNSDRLTRFL